MHSRKDTTMSLKNIVEKNHDRIYTLYGSMLIGCLIYTVISIAKKIIRK
jgi:hypothetical protein